MTDVTDTRPQQHEGPQQPPRERLAAAAERGDLDGVLSVLEEFLAPGLEDMGRDLFPDAMRYAREALENVGRDDPERLVHLLFARILAAEGALFVRAEHHVKMIVRDHDRRTYGQVGLPGDLAEHWLPRLHGIAEAIRRTCQSYATAAHALALARDVGESGAHPEDRPATAKAAERGARRTIRCANSNRLPGLLRRGAAGSSPLDSENAS